MCGICGELRLDQNLADLAVTAKMMEKLRPRGPDHAGSYSDGALSFGHRRLSIIDLSTKSNQPMIDTELGLSLVFNGTIYNYPELREELKRKGHHFVSNGDTEVILKAYREWGVDCPRYLDGMFAFAIWDMRHKTLFMARDRFGIKPFYWTRNSRFFRFASNPQALLAGGEVNTEIDSEALHFQFSLHGVVPAPLTILKGIRKLAPAHWMLIHQNGKVDQQAYWELTAQRPNQAKSEAEWISEIGQVLKQAVSKRNKIADVPVGVLLSGGLDSSLLVALLAELGLPEIKTFSIGFEDQPEEQGNEFEFSDQVVERYQTQHQKYLIANDAVLKRLPNAIEMMAEPMFGQDAVAFYLLSEQVSQQIKVVQSGQGADEVFGGYFWYYKMLKEKQGSRLTRFQKYYFDRDHAEFKNMIETPYLTQDVTADYISKALDKAGADSFMDAVLRLDCTTLIVDDPVKRVDNMTMAWGLEARVPFLDHHLVELASACPPEIKFKETGKYILKQIARGIVPDAIIDRPKGYFPMPALKYVRGEFLTMMQDTLNSQKAKERGLYQSAYIDRLLAAPEMHHTRIQGSKLWHLALLEQWLQTHL